MLHKNGKPKTKQQQKNPGNYFLTSHSRYREPVGQKLCAVLESKSSGKAPQ
jgi:hypothetical protein